MIQWAVLPATWNLYSRSECSCSTHANLTTPSCRQFNNPGDAVVLSADALQIIFWREWLKLGSPKMTPDERKSMMTLINRVLKDSRSEFFRVAGTPPVAMLWQMTDRYS
jgi:hypothetical protein